MIAGGAAFGLYWGNYFDRDIANFKFLDIFLFISAGVGSLFLFYFLLFPFTSEYFVCLCVCLGVFLFPLINLW